MGYGDMGMCRESRCASCALHPWMVWYISRNTDRHAWESKSSKELQSVSWLCCDGSLTSRAIPIAVAIEIQSILLSKHPSCYIVAAKTMMMTADTITKLGLRNE
jgi:hypothetical protein